VGGGCGAGWLWSGRAGMFCARAGGSANGHRCVGPGRAAHGEYWMPKFVVEGGRPLSGTIRPAGNKNAALPILKQLVDECNETAILGLYDSTRQQMVFAASVESPHPLRYVLEFNQWMPLHVGASGLAILAFLPVEERGQIIRRAGVDADGLTAQIESIRSKGYAYTRGQRIPGAVGIAAPIRESRRGVIGDLVVTIPDQRFDPQREPELASLVMKFADQVSERLDG
jgi:DNA-binding IclR family transcriptional regulator